MDQHMLSRLEAARRFHPEVDALMQQHQALEQQVSSLSTLPHLTPQEDAELHRLKKEKLRIKDQLEQFLQRRSA
jgi:uncharacterized protein YdcH (DUF465 family)